MKTKSDRRNTVVGSSGAQEGVAMAAAGAARCHPRTDARGDVLLALAGRCSSRRFAGVALRVCIVGSNVEREPGSRERT
jgi:hypothetical protein